MKKFLIGLAAGFVLAILTAVVLLLALARLAEPRPTVEAGSTLMVAVTGEIPEKPPIVVPFPAFESKAPLTVRELWTSIRAAAEEPKIEALVLMPAGLRAGWGKLYEIREALKAFKESGKPLIAYLRHPGAREYYLASAADEIYLSPEDLLDLKGLRIEAMYLRKTLEKLGVEVEIEHAGKYKDALDIFTRESMSPATREVLDSILDEMYAHLVGTLAEARGMAPAQVRALLDEGPFLAARAEEAKLVDGLIYEDELFDQIEERLEQEEIRKLNVKSYARYVSAQERSSGRPRIALLVGSGAILRGAGDDFGDEGALWSRKFIRTVRRLREDDSIRGVVLRIDSPGGDAVASDEILRELRLLSEKKPLVVSMSDVAASGGYYIAMTGDPVVAYPATFTGSIGVIYGKANLRGLYDKLGIRKEILKRGRYADIDSDYRPLGPEGRAKLREGIEAVYATFLDRVAEGRKREVDEIRPLAEGRVWLGIQAKNNGLIDELGGLDRALELVKEKAGIAPNERVALVPYPARKTLWEVLFTPEVETLFDARFSAALPEDLQPFLGALRLLERGGLLRWMPYRLEVR